MSLKIESINNLEPLNINKLKQIITSTTISEIQKINFIEQNQMIIYNLTQKQLSGKEYFYLMKNRPLIKFRPLKNSFTKKGDRLLLSKALGIPVSELDEYMEQFLENVSMMKDLDFLPEDKFDSIKTYIFRHGSKKNVIAVLDIELTKAKDKIHELKKTLEYHTGGMADYFIRPIHRMDNGTFIKLYKVLDKNIEVCHKTGLIKQAEKDELAEWALKRLYEIKHNSQFINAIKTYKVLSK